MKTDNNNTKTISTDNNNTKTISNDNNNTNTISTDNNNNNTNQYVFANNYNETTSDDELNKDSCDYSEEKENIKSMINAYLDKLDLETVRKIHSDISTCIEKKNNPRNQITHLNNLKNMYNIIKFIVVIYIAFNWSEVIYKYVGKLILAFALYMLIN
ncbi:hypothetical protein PFUGPA_00696 [Plasmodium falciparum Palo Alto/Uganda]|uniref:Uncharacterized protein n=1 Tax=Plasmodium falciparum (isolate Palo Alto / Uganda) TaxID=57270 RepID=W4J593_PLAFP|nr:hypothetical protein PFUGPA_00696 [Plasmodium falciparum Palo Alto/Uganda]